MRGTHQRGQAATYTHSQHRSRERNSLLPDSTPLNSHNTTHCRQGNAGATFRSEQCPTQGVCGPCICSGLAAEPAPTFDWRHRPQGRLYFLVYRARLHTTVATEVIGRVNGIGIHQMEDWRPNTLSQSAGCGLSRPRPENFQRRPLDYKPHPGVGDGNLIAFASVPSSQRPALGNQRSAE
jgi:hypothetical protein